MDAASIRRYAAAIALVAAATLVRTLLDPTLGARVPFAFHLLAVIFSSWFLGVWPGALATLTSVLAVNYLFVAPRFILDPLSPSNLPTSIVFVMLGLTVIGITSRWRRTERSLLESRNALQQRADRLALQGTLLEQAHDAIIVWDAGRRITTWNRGAEAMYGWTAQEALGQDVHALLHTGDAERQAMHTALSAAGVWSGRLAQRRKNGTAVIADSRQATIAGGSVLEVNRDDTERDRAEREARESHQLLRTTMDNFPTVIAFKDLEGRFIDVNAAVERALNRPKDEILHRSMDAFVPQDAASALRAHEQDVMTSRRATQFEEITPLASGTLHHLNTNFPLIDFDGRVYGTGHIAHDITAVKDAEEALLANERKLTALMDATAESIFLLDRHHVLAANRTAAARLGLTVDQVRGMDWHEIIPADVAASRHEVLEQVLATGKPIEFADRRDDHSFEHTFYPVFDAAGQPTAVATFSRDVTGHRRAEATLREMSQRLAYHVNHSPLAVIEFGPDLRLTRWAGEAERLFGWAADEVLGKRMTDFRWVHEDDLPLMTAVSSTMRTGSEPQRFSANRHYRKDGTVVHCEWYNSSLVDGAGQLQSILSLVLDVTERRRLERELRAQTQELIVASQVKDEFLATLSHELRTPLNAILGWSQILAKDTQVPDRLRRGLDTIGRNAALQARLVDDLLDVSRIVTGSFRLELQPMDLRTVADHAVDGIRPAADAKRLSLTAQVEEHLALTADPVRLQQVIWNLLSNAVKFTPAGGAVRLSVHQVEEDVEIAVSDTGIGIRADFLPYLFDRFRQADSSPSRSHMGMGLGLAIVRHIVELHGGTVSASSEGEGRGAVIRVRLPLSAAVVTASAERRGKTSLFD